MKGTNRLVVLSIVAATGLALPAVSAEPQSQSTSRSTSTQANQLGQLARANTLIGKEVMTSSRQTVGKLQNIVVDLESGRVLYGVVQGSSGKTVAVPPALFTNVRGDSILLNASVQQLRGAPTFNFSGSDSSQLGQASFVSQVYKYFGQNQWWQGSTPADQGSFHNVHQAKSLIGMNVKDVSNKDIGEVKNVVLDLPAGRVVYVIFAPNGSMDLGNNLYALPPDALTAGQGGRTLVTNLDRNKLAGAPHFTNERWPNIASTAYASEIYRYYGKQAYFESGSTTGLAPTGRSDQGQGWNEDQGGSFDNNSQSSDWRNRHSDWHDQNPRPNPSGGSDNNSF